MNRKVKIVINLNDRKLYLYINNILHSSYPVAIGKASTPTPTGNFRIIQKLRNPGGVFGSRWMRFYRGYGIHGTNNPSSIGKAVSNGCVRMLNSNINAIYDLVPLGTEVMITK
ncbi:L,D-transpeptidase catalytic domain [Alkalithermobacter thermoalcaliphilus JW-YL-7 = DSM 7308]|uniref:ErfK/YbiS/YcfS/YnhG family protein n=1 Tax=Alkalithermobacter thermoalcaliphilus JW-YL-7 = DSM 7308 TaxID=1121328 RepID=A0A150FS80_CLOPD|nr:ErfK/YbiS/YcfS/YnhG family protein [[Clostridium] paradoxum JW-YL-7 = DSM 7308]SHL16287.1 L,D-transpeptidase catalytic domain [[Clostridium] paradoxum JW-YL-7 = DSM 7308]